MTLFFSGRGINILDTSLRWYVGITSFGESMIVVL